MVGNEESFQIRVLGVLGISEDAKPGRGVNSTSPSAGAPEERSGCLDRF